MRTMKELVEAIAKVLVDNPDQVQVRAIEGEQVTVFELRKPTRAGFCHISTQSLLRRIVHMNGAAECSRWCCRKHLTTQQQKARTVR